MTITASVYIAASLDGFIAREDGAIDWLSQANDSIPPGEDFGYAEFMATVDVLVMGRLTYEQAARFDPWPYEGRRVVVLSHKGITTPANPGIQVELSSESPRMLLNRLQVEGCRHAYVDGGKTIQGFLSDGLIDRLTITTIPIILGSGRPLFGALQKAMKLKLVSAKAYDCGFVQSTYRAVGGT